MSMSWEWKGCLKETYRSTKFYFVTSNLTNNQGKLVFQMLTKQFESKLTDAVHITCD